MIQVEYKLKIGSDDFTLKADVEDEKEFFEKMSFYSSLPRTGPNGENDLKIVFRTTTEGHKYYSLVSALADQEFKFGQNKDYKKGVLFPKGWSPLFNSNTNGSVQTNGTTQNVAPIGVPQTQQAPTTPVPTQTVAQNTTQVAPSTQTAPQPVLPQTNTVPNNTQVSNVANDVLARFGIKQGVAQ